MSTGKTQSSLVGMIDPPIRGISQTVTFDVTAFEHAISTHGVRLVHFRAMRCPMGMVDKHDNRQPNHDHAGCSNGFIYQRVGVILALFTGNGSNHRSSDVGFVDSSTVQVTVHRRYETDEDCTEGKTPPDVFVANFDRFYLDEEALIVPTWQLVESHITGRDKLQFPCVGVEWLMDNKGNEYKEGVDFEVDKGYIVWGSRRPAFDVDANKGAIYSVRYFYRPYFYVKQVNHQIRMAQQENHEVGKREVVRMPQSMVLQREYMWETEVSSPNTEKTSGIAGVVPLPADGSFGPR